MRWGSGDTGLGAQEHLYKSMVRRVRNGSSREIKALLSYRGHMEALIKNVSDDLARSPYPPRQHQGYMETLIENVRDDLNPLSLLAM